MTNELVSSAVRKESLVRLGIRRKPTELPRKTAEPKRMVPFERATWGTGLAMQLPIQTVSEANTPEHWRKRARRTKEQKTTVAHALGYRLWHCDKRFAIQLTRLWTGKRPLDDDNLRGAFKHVRDAIASWLGVDDGSKNLTWEYAQERTEGNGIRIRIQVIEASAVR